MTLMEGVHNLFQGLHLFGFGVCGSIFVINSLTLTKELLFSLFAGMTGDRYVLRDV